MPFFAIREIDPKDDTFGLSNKESGRAEVKEEVKEEKRERPAVGKDVKRVAKRPKVNPKRKTKPVANNGKEVQPLSSGTPRRPRSLRKLRKRSKGSS